MLTVCDAIHGRRSIRAFDPQQPVSIATVNEILALGARAPNGSNIQPWAVSVLIGDALTAFRQELERVTRAGEPDVRDYSYYMSDWREPYLGRRRATGWGLYGLLGISKGDRDGSLEQMVRNYRFFDAPVGLIVSMERDMGRGAWLDMGCFIQTVLLAARGHGMEACPLASFCNYPNRIRHLLGLPYSSVIVTGIAIGFPLEGAAVNTYQTPREPVSTFATVYDRLPNDSTIELDVTRPVAPGRAA
ncbi:MAG: nitroreductase [Pseudomonadota bacterium]